jgi:AmmeMemoRadiSam system protein A
VSAPGTAGETLEPRERSALLGAARAAIAERLGAAPVASRGAATGTLAEHRGAFVTLRGRGDHELRGCVGRMVSDDPLVDTVEVMAIAAALEDGRFEPVTAAELPGLSLEISVLGPLRPIRPEAVEVGRHGLLVSRGHRRGVLLPQVPVEHGWDRETFLAHACLKAGLQPDAWRQRDTDLLAFTAEVFGEEE